MSRGSVRVGQTLFGDVAGAMSVFGLSCQVGLFGDVRIDSCSALCFQAQSYCVFTFEGSRARSTPIVRALARVHVEVQRRAVERVCLHAADLLHVLRSAQTPGPRQTRCPC